MDSSSSSASRFRTLSGIPVDAVYGDGPAPGEFPYTRGVHAEMYRARLWTMRMFAGFGTATDTNARFAELLAAGGTGLSTAFDMPTLMGRDSDHDWALGEVGRAGVAVDTVEDMADLFAGIDLGAVSTSMTINGPAPILLAMYVAVAEEGGVERGRLAGTLQNDILKEYQAQKEYIFPPRPSVRLVTDVIGFTTAEMPRWNPVSISGYHIREAGSTAAQELAFTLANGFAYVEAALAAGLDVDDFAPRIAFNFSVFNNVLEEVAKFRAARRIWARLLKEKYGAKNPRSLTFRTGAGSGGSTLVAQQPENNVVRVTLHTVIAAMAGVQSMHTASMDEAHALPSEEAATLALRTQQIVAYESGLADVIDPLGGSYYVENLTDQIEEQVEVYMKSIEERGGMVAAIESGWVVQEISESAFRFQREVEEGDRVVVGLNRFTTDETLPIELHRPDPSVARGVINEVEQLRKERDSALLARSLNDLQSVASEGGNLMPPTLEAIRASATVGEVSAALRDVYGEWRAPNIT